MFGEPARRRPQWLGIGGLRLMPSRLLVWPAVSASAAGVPSGVGVAVADSLLAMRFPAPCADPSLVDDFFGFDRRQGVADCSGPVSRVRRDANEMDKGGTRYRGSLFRMGEVNVCGGPKADGEEPSG